MSNKHILFFSKNCGHSKEFLQSLYKVPELFNKFEKICVDGNPKIPKGIKTVPTIIVPNCPTPLTDEKVFFWLDGMKRMMSQKQSQPPAKPQGQGQSQQGQGHDFCASGGGIVEGIQPFSSSFGGYSDQFSSIGDNPDPLEHSYEFLNGPPQRRGGNSVTMPKEDLGSDKNGKKAEMDKALEKIMAERNSSFQPIQRTS